jgi:hypothetical protein
VSLEENRHDDDLTLPRAKRRAWRDTVDGEDRGSYRFGKPRKYVDSRTRHSSDHPDVPANSVIRKLVGPSDYVLPDELVDLEPTFAHLMRQPEGWFYLDAADAGVNAFEAARTGQNTLEALRDLVMYFFALYLRRGGGDEELHRFDERVVHAALDGETVIDLPKRTQLLAACTQTTKAAPLLEGHFSAHQDLLTVAQAVRVAGVRSPSTITRWAAAGQLHGAHKDDKGSWLIPTASLLTYLNRAS